ncbi:transposase [Streptomyces sp. NPDC001221]
MSQFSAAAAPVSNFGVSPCDCLAHRFGNAADHGDRERRYPSDLTDAEWAAVRDALPMPRWLEGRGGRPESYCHRTMLDAVFYLVDGGIKWRAMPCDFPVFLWNQNCQEDPGLPCRTSTMGSSVAVAGTPI